MLAEERYKMILDLLEEQEIVKTQDLTRLTESSESTIRRDFMVLESEGLCMRVHGGAKKVYRLHPEQEMEAKSSLHVEEKKKIALQAAAFIKEQEMIFLDAGSTTYEMIPFLQDKNVTVVTNGVPHASLLADLRIPSILLGGKIKPQTKATIGPETMEQIRQYRFSKAFLGINGIHLLYGYTTPDPEEAAVKRKAIDHAAQSYILADSSKFKGVAFAKVADLNACDIISCNLDSHTLSLLEQNTNYWEANA